MIGILTFSDMTKLLGKSFGAHTSVAGEVVFCTGIVGYPESLTDPSYAGQILVFTYPLIGNYGIPEKDYWESEKIQVAGIIVSHYSEKPSHWQSRESLSSWLKRNNIPGLEISDTRFVTQKLREKGAMLGKITIGKDIDFSDPNQENLVARVSRKNVLIEGKGKRKKIILIDCGAKKNIAKCLLKRGLQVITVPHDFDFFKKFDFDGVVVSNGPGDPKMTTETISIVRRALDAKKPILGVCLGNQILALAAGGDTYKLKFGHRSQNQPCILVNSQRCYLTTQNHGFAVGKMPEGFKSWFINANDNTNEGIIHSKYPWMSAQFHPEASPGPVDTEWIFDYFLEKANII